MCKKGLGNGDPTNVCTNEEAWKLGRKVATEAKEAGVDNNVTSNDVVKIIEDVIQTAYKEDSMMTKEQLHLFFQALVKCIAPSIAVASTKIVRKTLRAVQ